MASRNPILFDGASRESVALARDWHTGNWISVEHVDEKRFCAKGTRPGDLVFNVAMSWVITQARSQVPPHEVSASSSALPFPVLDDSVAVSCSDVSFVNDFALLVASASPTDLLDNVRRHVRAYSELLAVFGLSLNMSPGKTEAFVTFRGQGAKDAASRASSRRKTFAYCAFLCTLGYFDHTVWLICAGSFASHAEYAACASPTCQVHVW